MSKLFLYKLYIYITKSEKNYSKKYFYINIGYKKCFLEQQNFFKFNFYFKAC